MTAIKLEAPEGFRRLILITALLLVGLELAAFWYAARLTMLLTPGRIAGAELGAFIAFWSLLTLQAMVVTGLAWTLVALSRTVLRADAEQIVVSHPWRRWSGAWTEIAEAYVSRDWLHLRARGRWRTWHVKLDRDVQPAIDRVRASVPRDAWLNADQARGVLLKRLLPPILLGAAVGGGAILVLNQWIARVLERAR